MVIHKPKQKRRKTPILKIRMHTDQQSVNAKYKRSIAPREGFLDIDENTNEITIKQGQYKCKPWDTEISRRKDHSYIQYKKQLNSGLCFRSKKQAEIFMEKHQSSIDNLAKSNPIFHHWSICPISKRFEPIKKRFYLGD